MATTEPEEEWWLKPDVVRSMLAFIVVAGGLACITIVRILVTSPGDYVTGVVALMSGVLGWYFGTRGVEKAETRASVALTEKQEATAKVAALEEKDEEIASIGPDMARDVDRLSKILRAATKNPALKANVEEVIGPIEDT